MPSFSMVADETVISGFGVSSVDGSFELLRTKKVTSSPEEVILRTT